MMIVEINEWTTGDTGVGIRGGRGGAVWIFLLEGVGVEEGAVVVDVGVYAGDGVSLFKGGCRLLCHVKLVRFQELGWIG